jgi:4a-hydroxytetrahydrobiopterin dehydratase
MLATQNCKPCEGGVAPLSKGQIQEWLKAVPDWELTADGRFITREFKFSDYLAALLFVNKLSNIAEDQGHHPDVFFGYGYCKVSFQTHAIDGLYENDFIMAAKIDDLLP